MWLFKKISQAVSSLDKFKQDQLGFVFDLGKGGFYKKKEGYKYKKWYQPFWDKPKQRSVYYSSCSLEELAAKAGITETDVSASAQEPAIDELKAKDNDSQLYKGILSALRSCLEQLEKSVDEHNSTKRDRVVFYEEHKNLHKKIASAMHSYCINKLSQQEKDEMVRKYNSIVDKIDKISPKCKNIEEQLKKGANSLNRLNLANDDYNLKLSKLQHGISDLQSPYSSSESYEKKLNEVKDCIAELRKINPISDKHTQALSQLDKNIDQLINIGYFQAKHATKLQTLKENVHKLLEINPLDSGYKSNLEVLQKNFAEIYNASSPSDPRGSKSIAMLGVDMTQRRYNENSWGLQVRGGLLWQGNKKAEVTKAPREYLLYSAKRACCTYIQQNSFAAARVALRVYFSYVLASGNIPEAYPENETLMRDLTKAENGYVVDMKELETRLEGNPHKDKIIAHRNEAIQRRDYVDKDALLKLANRLPTTYDNNVDD